MSESPEWLRLIWEIMVTLISGGAAVYAYSQVRHAARRSVTDNLTAQIVELKHEKVGNEAINRLWEETAEIDRRRSSNVGEIKDRLKDIESAQRHMPSNKEINQLNVNVAVMMDTLSILKNQVQTMDDYLRKREP